MWLLIVLLTLPRLPFEGKLTPELKSQLEVANNNEKIYVIVHMSEPYPYEEIESLSIQEKAQIFKEIARRSQKPLIDYLKQLSDEVDDIKTFWVFNGFHMRATKNIIREILERKDVRLISHNSEIIKLPQIALGEELPSRAIEWNISKVMADSCWAAGFTGDSIFIGQIDTGMDTSHPALQGKWSGKWKDCINAQPSPYDDHGHGTHTFGTICGGDGLGPFENDIGVAPGAKMIVAKAFNSSGAIHPEAVDSAMQWLAYMKADSGYDIRAVACAWGWSNTTSLRWWDICNTWKSLQILPIFIIGNSGPDSGTAVALGNYPICIGTGGTDVNDTVTSWSSRGPAPDLAPWNNSQYWYRPNWNLTKPDIVAPGVDIRSAIPGGGYQSMNGTNMSTTHVAGAVAILCQANPNLTVTELYNILLDNADHPPPGAPYPNNTYGWGRLNIWTALKAVLGISDNERTEVSKSKFQVFPTLFSKEIEIAFSLSRESEKAKIEIFDICGRLVNEFSLLTSITWDGTDQADQKLPSGVYFVRLETPDFKETKKVILLR
jgi:bacillopeptidase F